MGWQFWVDRGGTFTDIVARPPDGDIRTHKLLSQDPRYPDAAVAGIRPRRGEHDRPDIAAGRTGTTDAPNALLDGGGEPTVPGVTGASADAPAHAHADPP